MKRKQPEGARPAATGRRAAGAYGILDGLADGALVFDADGRCLYVNDAGAAQLGKRKQVVLQHTLADLLPELAANPSGSVARCLAERCHGEDELEMQSADGKTRWLAVGIHPVAEGLLLLLHDVTARKIAEVALLESEQGYRELFDDAPVGYHEIDLNGIITRINRTEARLLGYETAEMVGRPVWDFVMDREESERAVRGKMAGDQALGDFERRYLRKDGRPVDLLIQEHLIRDGTGDVIGVRSVVTDISRRKNIEVALRESERALSALLSNLPGMAYRCRYDDRWTMELVSEGCAKLTGYQPAHLIGNRRLSYLDIIHPDDREDVRGATTASVEQDRPFTLQYRIVRADGEERWVWEQGRGVRSFDGRVVALEGFITDTTDRVRAEEALRRSEQQYRDLARRFEHEASHDALTGCYNRRSMRNMLESELARAKRYGRPLSLALMDIDKMKQVNDTFGHDVGDAVLCQLAMTVMGEKRAADSLARWGGDEFVLIMPDTTAAQAEMPVRRIARVFRGAVKKMPNLPPAAAELGIGVSLGVVEWCADESVDDVLKRADQLMYDDKRGKR